MVDVIVPADERALHAVRALLSNGLAALDASDVRLASDHLQAASALLVRLSPPAPVLEHDVLSVFGLVFLAENNPSTALAYFLETARRASSLPPGAGRGPLAAGLNLLHAGTALGRLGRHAESRELASRAVAVLSGGSLGPAAAGAQLRELLGAARLQAGASALALGDAQGALGEFGAGVEVAVPGSPLHEALKKELLGVAAALAPGGGGGGGGGGAPGDARPSSPRQAAAAAAAAMVAARPPPYEPPPFEARPTGFSRPARPSLNAITAAVLGLDGGSARRAETARWAPGAPGAPAPLPPSQRDSVFAPPPAVPAAAILAASARPATSAAAGSPRARTASSPRPATTLGSPRGAPPLAAIENHPLLRSPKVSHGLSDAARAHKRALRPEWRPAALGAAAFAAPPAAGARLDYVKTEHPLAAREKRRAERSGAVEGGGDAGGGSGGAAGGAARGGGSPRAGSPLRAALPPALQAQLAQAEARGGGARAATAAGTSRRGASATATSRGGAPGPPPQQTAGNAMVVKLPAAAAASAAAASQIGSAMMAAADAPTASQIDSAVDAAFKNVTQDVLSSVKAQIEAAFAAAAASIKQGSPRG
jgi:hypothetical protein